MHAEPLGTAEDVMAALSTVYPAIRWQRTGMKNPVFWHGHGPNGVNEPYLDVLLQEEAGGTHFVVLNKAAPSVMRKIMEAMRLNYVCAIEAEELVDPYAYGDEDRYYVRKAWINQE
jgi:hypothetical protein